MKKYTKFSISTMVLLLVIFLLQFVPTVLSSIISVIVLIAYFGYMIYKIKIDEIETVLINMFEFSFALLIYVVVIEVIIWDVLSQ